MTPRVAASLTVGYRKRVAGGLLVRSPPFGLGGRLPSCLLPPLSPFPFPLSGLPFPLSCFPFPLALPPPVVANAGIIVSREIGWSRSLLRSRVLGNTHHTCRLRRLRARFIAALRPAPSIRRGIAEYLFASWVPIPPRDEPSWAVWMLFSRTFPETQG